VTPATGSDSYRGKASITVEAAISEVETTRITVQALLDDQILIPYADETITASETALDSIGAAFGSVQPPVGSDELRESVSTLVWDAEDAVAAARIAARRSEGGRVGEWIVAVWRRLHPSPVPEPGRIPVADVVDVDSAVHVGRRQEALSVDGLERWVDAHVVSRLPGSRHDPK
jgi:hypothetical protein